MHDLGEYDEFITTCPKGKLILGILSHSAHMGCTVYVHLWFEWFNFLSQFKFKFFLFHIMIMHIRQQYYLNHNTYTVPQIHCYCIKRNSLILYMYLAQKLEWVQQQQQQQLALSQTHPVRPLGLQDHCLVKTGNRNQISLLKGSFTSCIAYFQSMALNSNQQHRKSPINPLF